MTDPKSRPQLPSERYLEIFNERLRLNGGDTAYNRWGALMQYLDERETQLHPLPRAHLPTNAEDEALTDAAVAHANAGKRTRSMAHPFGGPCTCAHAENHSLPHEPGCAGYREPAHPAPMSPPSEEAPPLPVAHRVTLEVMRERDDLRARINELEADAATGTRIAAESVESFQMFRQAEARIQQLEAETMTLTSERDTARMGQDEWRSRYADLANAAAGAVGVLAVNDPAQRMVKERIEGALAGHEPERSEVVQRLETLTAKVLAHSVDHVELARLKEENARLSAKAENWEKLYNQALRDCGHIDTELRKRDAVVETARKVLGAHTISNTVRKGMLMVELRERLRALDRTEGEQAATPPEPPAPVEVVREIRVGSRWKHTWGSPKGALGLRTVEAVNVHGLGHIKLEGISGTWGANFRNEFEWVSDPEPPAERPVVGEGEP